MDLGSLTDCFCQLDLGDQQQVSRVVPDCIDPVFDETFHFNVVNCAGQVLRI
jgi:hypothetical protein